MAEQEAWRCICCHPDHDLDCSPGFDRILTWVAALPVMQARSDVHLHPPPPPPPGGVIPGKPHAPAREERREERREEVRAGGAGRGTIKLKLSKCRAC